VEDSPRGQADQKCSGISENIFPVLHDYFIVLINVMQRVEFNFLECLQGIKTFLIKNILQQLTLHGRLAKSKKANTPIFSLKLINFCQ
jgi:hypothetical protein